MGDADSKVLLSAQANENWMVGAFGSVDERLENLLLLVTNLHERVNEIATELKILKISRNVFVALNFFIVPVILAIMLCYGTQASFNINSNGIEAVIQRLVMLFMFSSSVGLAWYILSIWKSFFTPVDANEEPNGQSLDDLLIALTKSLSDEFARFLQNPVRMPSKFRRDSLRVREIMHWGNKRASDSFEPSQSLEMVDSSETVMDLAFVDASDSVEPSEQKPDELASNSLEGELKEMVRYRFKLRMNGQSPDLAVKLKPANREEREESVEDVGEIVEQSAKEPAESPENSPSIPENDEERNISIAVASPELHTCKDDLVSEENQPQTQEISCQ